MLVKSLPQGTADRTKPPCCIFVLESHQGANQAKYWSRLSFCTLDLALVIGHALFDWDKVITCYLFRHCPSQSAVLSYVQFLQIPHTVESEMLLRYKWSLRR